MDADWIERARGALDDLRVEALELVAREGVEVDPAGAEEAARAAVAAAPFRESARTALIEVLRRRGNVAEAVRAYEDLRVLLRDELGTVPGPELVALHARLLAPGPARPRRACGRRAAQASRGGGCARRGGGCAEPPRQRTAGTLRRRHRPASGGGALAGPAARLPAGRGAALAGRGEARPPRRTRAGGGGAAAGGRAACKCGRAAAQARRAPARAGRPRRARGRARRRRRRARAPGAGHGGLLLFEGPAGIGKTRLLTELRTLRRARGARR